MPRANMLKHYYYYYCRHHHHRRLVTGLFFLVLLLNQRWSPVFRLQASHCSTFRIMCYVPCIAVFCSESTECFPGVASKPFLYIFCYNSGGSSCYRYHHTFHDSHSLSHVYKRWIYSLFIFFSVTLLCTSFATSITMRGFSFSILIILSGLLLLLLSLSSSLSPLCRVFIHIFLRQTMSLGNTVFQLFSHYYLWCL